MHVDIASGGRDRERENRPEYPADRRTKDQGEHDDARVEVRRIALDLRHEEVVLKLLDPEVEDERRGGRLDAGSCCEQDGRDRSKDRPDDRQQLEDACDDREQDRKSHEDRVYRLPEYEQADERPDSHDQAEQELPADPGPENAADDRSDRLDIR